jgi:tetratricopeptide (TPR) repeat protein
VTVISGLWNYDDPVGSEQRLRDAADRAAGAERMLILAQVARALGLQERYAEAHRELDRVEAARRRLPGIGRLTALALQAHVALERGRLHRSSGDPERAGEHLEDAATLAREAGEAAVAVDAAHMLALVEPRGPFAVRLHRQALKLARASEDPAVRRWEAPVLNNLGCALVDIGRTQEALSVFEEALALRRAAEPAGEETRIARYMVARTLRLLGRTEEALQIQRELKAQLIAEGREDPHVDEELSLLGS